MPLPTKYKAFGIHSEVAGFSDQHTNPMAASH